MTQHDLLIGLIVIFSVLFALVLVDIFFWNDEDDDV